MNAARIKTLDEVVGFIRSVEMNLDCGPCADSDYSRGHEKGMRGVLGNLIIHFADLAENERELLVETQSK